MNMLGTNAATSRYTGQCQTYKPYERLPIHNSARELRTAAGAISAFSKMKAHVIAAKVKPPK